MKTTLFMLIGFGTLLAFTSCVSVSNFQSWSGPAEFQGKGGSFRKVDGIDVYSIGEPYKRYRVIGIIKNSTFSSAGPMAAFANGFATAKLAKEAKQHGGDAIILIRDNSNQWTSGSPDGMGNYQSVTDVNREMVVAVVKYIDESAQQERKKEVIGTTKSDPEAKKTFDQLKAKAESGDAEAQSILGSDYYFGRGLTQDYNEAVTWSRKAAEQGNARSQCLVGLMYAQGHGVLNDNSEAVRWFRKSADQGFSVAENKLGMAYWFGDKGVPENLVEAYKWLSLAAAQGDDQAIQALKSVRNEMTPEQIAKAQELANEFMPRKEGSVTTATGFFITTNGYLISNYHVVKGAAKIQLVTGAGTVDARVVQTDAANDLALLKIANAEGRMKNAETFRPLPIASSRNVALGSTVVTVGFPDPGLQGFSPKFARGEIAALAGAGDDARYFQISLPVQPGNSGGALVDGRGNVVGIVSAKLDPAAALASSGSLPENVNYAVKSSFLLGFLESVPEVARELKEPNAAKEKAEDVVKDAQAAAVLVLVY